MGLTKATYSMIVGAPINVLDYGAFNDGTNAATTTNAIRAAILAAQQTLSNIYFPAGRYAINDTILLQTTPIGFVGEQNPVWQQGSDLPSVTLEWVGGAAPMFQCSQSNFQFEGMAVANKGTATDFLRITNGIRYRFYRMSWVWGAGTTPFSRSVIYCDTPSFGYSTVSSCQFGAAAPVFLYVDGGGAGYGLTPFVFDDRCIFESAAGQSSTIVYLKSCVADSIIFKDCTFNQQGDELCIFNNEDTTFAFPAVQSFTFSECEWDYSVAGAVTDRAMRLENVANIVMTGNHFQCGGTVVSAIDLTNCRVTEFNGNYIRSVDTFFNADAATFITAGHNDVDISNVGKLITDAAKGYVDVTWATPNTFFGLQGGDPGRTCIYRISVPTAGAAWNIGLRHGSQGFSVPGQVFTLLIRNTSGGVINAPTFDSSMKVSGAFTPPADGFSRTITFVFDGTNYIELGRSAADVPN